MWNTLNTLLLCLRAVLIMILVVTCHSFRVLAQNNNTAQNGVTEISVEIAKQKALDFLNTPGFPLTHRGFQSWGTEIGKGKKCYHFEGPQEESLYVDVDSSSGRVCLFTWGRLATSSQKVLVEQKRAIDIANKFLRSRSRDGLPKALELTKQELVDHGAGGKIYHFRLVRVEGNIRYPFLIKVGISAQSGQITDYLVVEHPVTLPSLQPKISNEQALVLVKKALVSDPQAKLDPGWTVYDSYLVVTAPYPEQRLEWSVKVRGTRTSDYTPEMGQIRAEALYQVQLDASTGEVTASYGALDKSGRVVQLRPPVPQPKFFTTVSMWPSWSGEQGPTLSYIWRELEPGYVRDDTPSNNKGVEGYKGIITTTFQGKATPLLWFPTRPNRPTWTSDRNRIAFEMWLGGPLYI